MSESTPVRRQVGPGRPVPRATYRLQLGPDLTFDDAAAQVDYLAALGVSHLYLSPILAAAPGSTHGYDVVDHSRISDVLGGREGFDRLVAAAHDAGLGIVVDIVPNHMSLPVPAWQNAQLWSLLAEGPASPYASWFDIDWTTAGGNILMPVLGDRIGTVLGSGELTLDEADIPGFGPTTVLRYYDHVFPVRDGTADLPLVDLVDRQFYRLAYWRVADEELNYRRFFDIDTLAGLRVEDEDVFDATHALTLDLVADGSIDGLRIDHIDGLADPVGYLDRLAERTGSSWVVVEKILADDEALPDEFSCAGTTGYETAWRLGALFTDPVGARDLAAVMRNVAGDSFEDWPNVVRQAKLDVLTGPLAAEVNRLVDLSSAICYSDVRLRDHTAAALRDCYLELLVAANRYRYYVIPGRPTPPDTLAGLATVAAKARDRLPAERHATLDVLVDLLTGQEVGSAGQTTSAARADLVIRFQQVCGAVEAKAVEDTTFYRWTHLLSLCDVGSAPYRFALGPSELHAWLTQIAHGSPLTLTSLTTHDSKRSADTRIAIAVASEYGSDWVRLVDALRADVVTARPQELDGRTEQVLWQTLAGTWSRHGPLASERLSGYLVKAMREARSQTTWVSPNEAYEDAVLTFAAMVRQDAECVEMLADWYAHTADVVASNTLGMTAIHLTMPGIPDLYQGTEEVRRLLVDPDNRGPADWPRLRADLGRLLAGESPDTLSGAKLALTAAALRCRADVPDAFTGPVAGYLPLATTTGHLFAFARTNAAGPQVLTLATRLPVELARLGGWGQHTVTLPDGTWRDVTTGVERAGGPTPIADVVAASPVAILRRVGP